MADSLGNIETELTDEQILAGEGDVEDSKSESSEKEDSDEEATEESTEEAETESELADVSVEEEDSEEAESTEEAEEESTEEETETEKPIETTTFRDIKAKYPNLFKEFPALKAAFGEAKQYKQVFADINEARQVANEIENYRALEEDIFNGNPLGLIKAISHNEPAAQEFARNILPALHRINPDLFFEAAIPVVARVLNNVIDKYKDGTDQTSKNYVLGAKYVANFIFQKNGEIPDFSISRSARNVADPEKARLIQERNEFLDGRRNEVAQEMNKEIKGQMLSAMKKHLSPLKGEKPFVIKKVQEEVLRALDYDASQDDEFIGHVGNLFKKAAKTGFTDKATISRIKSAFLERGNQRVAFVVDKVLKYNNLVASKKIQSKKVGGQSSGNVNRGRSERNINAKDIDWRRTSDEDVLAGNYKLKGQK